MKRVKKFIKEEKLLLFFLLVFIVLLLLHPTKAYNFYFYIHWPTIATLMGLLMITTGIKESNYFNHISKKFIKQGMSERKIALILVILTAILSTFLTNDVSLFIVVPFTLTLQNQIRNDLLKLVIFEAIAANIGSALTPIGNPQNIFIWHKWGIGFVEFMIKLFPLFIFSLIVLIIFVFVFFKSVIIEYTNKYSGSKEYNKKLFNGSIVLLIIYIILLQTSYYVWFIPVIFVYYFVIARNIIFKTDWLLILLFIVFFIDFGILSNLSIVIKFLTLYVNKIGIFIVSIFLSQVISNVPAVIVLSNFSNDYFSLVYGVNLAGNGIIIGSLANIIALRLSRQTLIEFHKYSILFFLITFLIFFFMFF